MINKYFLVGKILENELLTEVLKQDSSEEYFFEEKSLEELYDERLECIDDFILMQCIEPIENLTGKEVTEIIKQRDWIIKQLKNSKDYNITIFISNDKSFKDAIESSLNITHNHIKDYNKAINKLNQRRSIPVFLDENNTKLFVNGEEKTYNILIDNNNVSIEDCISTINELNDMGCYPKKLTFNLSVFTETSGNEFGDFPEECILNKKAYYFVENNCLRIWENNLPVYENIDGKICTDTFALQDSLM